MSFLDTQDLSIVRYNARLYMCIRHAVRSMACEILNTTGGYTCLLDSLLDSLLDRLLNRLRASEHTQPHPVHLLILAHSQRPLRLPLLFPIDTLTPFHHSLVVLYRRVMQPLRQDPLPLSFPARR